MNTCKVRNVELGKGTPKIIVPIVGETKEQIIDAARSFRDVKVDIVEWRVDWFENVFEAEKVTETAKELREVLKDTPILFTFRTAKEGGEKAISAEDYVACNKNAVDSGQIDMVDVEAFTGDEYVKEIIEYAHSHNVKVVASNHDFDKTPAKEELVSRLRKMQELDADIPKIAVMPQNTADVLTLLDATRTMAEEYADRPIITMSMAGLGLISRLSGQVFGSCATFGAVGKVSAPGQMDAVSLNQVLTSISENM